MSIDERSRHQLHVKLEEILGAEEASTLMAHLPPVGWADVATKRDLDQLAAQNSREHEQLATKLELQEMKSEVVEKLHSEIRSEIRSATRTFIAVMTTLTTTLAGIAFGAAHLI